MSALPTNITGGDTTSATYACGAAPYVKDIPMYELYQRVASHPENFLRLLDKIRRDAGD
ncbi:hypothetical protein [Micromonospora sp. NPDC047187]|uniref:hypothetical protein n=1 Tax=Micromonospora sp. NPDC047187 TaxID=3155262 RepID=UPI0033C7B953